MGSNGQTYVGSVACRAVILSRLGVLEPFLGTNGKLGSKHSWYTKLDSVS